MSPRESTTYQVIVQNILTSALLDTGVNTSAISERFFRLLPQEPLFLKVYTHEVQSASGANLGTIGQGNLILRLGNKQFTSMSIILWKLHKNIILGLIWQYNKITSCNWNVNGHQYITHNNKEGYQSHQ